MSSAFAEALSEADSVVLLPIYPARELPIEGVSSALIANKMEKGKVQQFDDTSLLKWIEVEFKKELMPSNKEILIVAGAGDIDQLVTPIKEILVKS